jgi:5-(carboxyamino)imidazole ribonucleotide mutase
MKIAFILGSDSDLPIVEKGLTILRELELPFVLRILSAHRTPAAVSEFVSNLDADQYGAIIAVAGKAAHLPGVVAAQTLIPVIGLPIDGGMDGLDALLSIVQMPKGIPVACVGINNAQNAALLAAQLLAQYRPEVRARLQAYRQKQTAAVLEKDRVIGEKYNA